MSTENTSSDDSSQEKKPLFVIRRGEVYSSDQVVRAYGIGPNTLEGWVEEGLRYGRRGTRSRYFLGDHLINFMFGE